MTAGGLPRVIVVTGTDTDVGKTVVTAAVCATLRAAGLRVTAYKPTQTGVGPLDTGDMAEVSRLTGVPTHEGVRLLAPMAPRPAAALEGATLPTLEDHLTTIEALSSDHDQVVVEGAGGLLVELTEARATLADLSGRARDCGVLVVARSALGTLNHTMLTREALWRRGIHELGVVLGSWPSDPTVIETSNRDYLAELPEGLLGAIPTGAPRLDPSAFRAAAAGWLPGLARRSAGAQRRETP
ncbi:dethiobiotin synthase [Humibacillus xanthopallidus]|uniref:ATP-dependent dethiobiotin synthetase BioD n=1 Tax=Humibacillus xanthopallidus TaxID=412689 RepID=A0A543HW05_9MICO|nr:dethiobiotin synthase [Humibacillus xanthopallidus]TQM62490.1 dethiobiotin synthetase [Humibacillus xanthopallidus]